jgi:hypothetical protein
VYSDGMRVLWPGNSTGPRCQVPHYRVMCTPGVCSSLWCITRLSPTCEHHKKQFGGLCRQRKISTHRSEHAARPMHVRACWMRDRERASNTQGPACPCLSIASQDIKKLLNTSRSTGLTCVIYYSDSSSRATERHSSASARQERLSPARTFRVPAGLTTSFQAR